MLSSEYAVKKLLDLKLIQSQSCPDELAGQDASDRYNIGLYNGLEMAIAVITETTPTYK